MLGLGYFICGSGGLGRLLLSNCRCKSRLVSLMYYVEKSANTRIGLGIFVFGFCIRTSYSDLTIRGGNGVCRRGGLAECALEKSERRRGIGIGICHGIQ